METGGWGFEVVFADYPTELDLTAEERRKLGDEDYQPDLIVKYNGQPVGYWDSTHRDKGFDEPYFIPFDQKVARYKKRKAKKGLPVYISLWVKGEWLGYDEIGKLKVVVTNPIKYSKETLKKEPLEIPSIIEQLKILVKRVLAVLENGST